MNFFKRPYVIRRYAQPETARGYVVSIPYADLTLPMDAQTMSDEVRTTPDGSEQVKSI